MNILITGNVGYIGSVLIPYLKNKYNNYKIYGFDNGYFNDCLLTKSRPEKYLTKQFFGDIRKNNFQLLKDFKIDTVVHLAGLSNDPIGNIDSKITHKINTSSSIKLIDKSKEYKVSNFVFASSCSIYGKSGNRIINEKDSLNPLTHYAKSKIDVENYIDSLSNNNLQFTKLRFATACGSSPRLRLDLVLNDFVTSAYLNKEILLLSDGSSWRPIIDVFDMCRSIDWAIHRNIYKINNNLSVNIGSNLNNLTILDLAKRVSTIIDNTKVTKIANAQKDNRSYKVSFNLFNKLAKNYLPIIKLDQTIVNLYKQVQKINFKNEKFRESSLIRLHYLKQLQKTHRLTKNLYWKK